MNVQDGKQYYIIALLLSESVRKYDSVSIVYGPGSVVIIGPPPAELHAPPGVLVVFVQFMTGSPRINNPV